jgi:Flp pilus assembly protein TadG
MAFIYKAKALYAQEQGSSVLELSLITPLLLLLLFGAIDVGRAYYLSMEVVGAAHAGATYAVGRPSDTTGIRAAALADAPDVPGLTVSTPTYGCECSDGGSYSANCGTTPTCSNNVVYLVKVTATATYKSWFPWPGLPPTFSMSNSASMRSGG